MLGNGSEASRVPASYLLLAAERGDEAQRPLQRLLSTPDSGTERLLGSGDWQASTNSSQKAGEPSLLGSGWSWQTPRDVQEFLTTSSLNNTADSETLRGKMSISSVRTGQTSDDTRYSIPKERTYFVRPPSSAIKLNTCWLQVA